MPNEYASEFERTYRDHGRRIETLEDWVRNHEQITGERMERLVAMEQQLLQFKEFRDDLKKLGLFAIAQTIAILGMIISTFVKH